MLTTPCCPECGEHRAGPLSELYRHVASSARSQTTRAQGLRKGLEELSGNLRKGAAHGVEEAEATAAKWRCWAEALREVMDRQTDAAKGGAS